jgi:hypothetical protein
VSAGFLPDWGRIGSDQMIEASQASFKTGDSSGLAALLRMCFC